MITSGMLFGLLLTVTVAILAFVGFAQRSRSQRLDSGLVARTLGWIAATEFILGLLIAIPFPAPTNDGVWQMILASFITTLFGLPAFLMHLDSQTPAVVRSRMRREELRRQRQY